MKAKESEMVGKVVYCADEARVKVGLSALFDVAVCGGRKKQVGKRANRSMHDTQDRSRSATILPWQTTYQY